jgi:ABC-type uncharacterized transport system substrate-binding protein
MKKYINILIGVVVFLSVSFILIFGFYKKSEYSPRTNNGLKWRIGYYEGGSYTDYQTYFLALIKGLDNLGWLQKIDLPKFKENDNMKVVWNELVKNKSKYIQFVKEAYWSADWYDNKRIKNKLEAIKYLRDKKLDLIIAGGTWGGLDLANNEHSVPVLVISTSDPIKAEIINSANDSGFDHVHATCDPDRYVRQLRAFHNIVKFKKLGVVFEDTHDGRVYASLEDVLKVSLEADFDIVTCIAFDQNLSEEESMKGVYKCHEELATKVDAVYITAHRGTNPKWMPNVLKPLFDNNIPTFAQEGPDQVRRGAMLSIARLDTEDMGLYYAETIAKILNGILPRKINQIFEQDKRIVINIKTAELIGYDIPQVIIDAADKIYERIEDD